MLNFTDLTFLKPILQKLSPQGLPPLINQIYKDKG